MQYLQLKYAKLRKTWGRKATELELLHAS